MALGGAIRAAQHGMNLSLEELETIYCKTGDEIIQPIKASKDAYDEAIGAIKSMLLTL